MEKIICILLCVSMLLSLSIVASDLEKSEDTVSNMSETLVSKNYISGEIEYTTYTVDEEIESSTYEDTFDDTFVETEFSVNTVIGSDNRTKVSSTKSFPYSAICYVVSTWADGHILYGTGFLIYEDVALTAAYYAYSSAHGGWAETVELYPGKSGSGNAGNVYGSTTMKNATVSTNWTSSANSDYNWAILDLNDAIGQETGWFNINYLEDGDISGKNITITGYPSNFSNYQYTMSGEVTAYTTKKLKYTIDTSAGQAGSPIYNTSTYVVYGIHCYSGTSTNSGVRITKTLYNYCLEHRS